jgi:hypothetical protein
MDSEQTFEQERALRYIERCNRIINSSDNKDAVEHYKKLLAVWEYALNNPGAPARHA